MVFSSLNKFVSFSAAIVSQVSCVVSSSVNKIAQDVLPASRSKAVSFSGAIANQMYHAVSTTVAKTAEDVLPAYRYKAHGSVEDVSWNPRVQIAKDEGYCVVERVDEILI